MGTYDVTDLLNEREERKARRKFYFMKVGLIQRHFPENVSETSGTIERRGFRFSHRDSVNITLAVPGLVVIQHYRHVSCKRAWRINV